MTAELVADAVLDEQRNERAHLAVIELARKRRGKRTPSTCFRLYVVKVSRRRIVLEERV
jgi:hypothetical protein